MVSDAINVQVKCRFEHTVGEEFSLKVKFLNLAFVRKYSYAEFVENDVQLTIERVPALLKEVNKRPDEEE